MNKIKYKFEFKTYICLHGVKVLIMNQGIHEAIRGNMSETSFILVERIKIRLSSINCNLKN